MVIRPLDLTQRVAQALGICAILLPVGVDAQDPLPHRFTEVFADSTPVWFTTVEPNGR